MASFDTVDILFYFTQWQAKISLLDTGVCLISLIFVYSFQFWWLPDLTKVLFDEGFIENNIVG